MIYQKISSVVNYHLHSFLSPSSLCSCSERKKKITFWPGSLPMLIGIVTCCNCPLYVPNSNKISKSSMTLCQWILYFLCLQRCYFSAFNFSWVKCNCLKVPKSVIFQILLSKFCSLKVILFASLRARCYFSTPRILDHIWF